MGDGPWRERREPRWVLLHGGRAFGETGLFRYFNGPLEQSFTASGAGKSFGRAIPRTSMTVEQRRLDLLAPIVAHTAGCAGASLTPS